MKLRRERIEFLANLIITKLLENEMIILDDVVAGKMAVAKVIIDDLLVEDDLDDEVREILRQHADEIDKQRIPYHEMFKIVKDKLVKERNLIL